MADTAPRSFRVDTYHGAGDVMVIARGDLDVANVARLDGALHRAVEKDGYRDIIIDLADVHVVDATAISVLFKWSQSLRAHGVELVLSAPSASALAALRGSGLYEMFTVTRT
jgi:anti-anti-sigma factor